VDSNLNYLDFYLGFIWICLGGFKFELEFKFELIG
jgi:hypothetical protein